MKKSLKAFLAASVILGGGISLAACGGTTPSDDVVSSSESSEAQTFTVTLHLNGGTLSEGQSTTLSVTEGSKLSLPTPKKVAEEFKGWFNGEDADATEVKSDSVVTSNLDLYAKWDNYATIANVTSLIEGMRNGLNYTVVYEEEGHVDHFYRTREYDFSEMLQSGHVLVANTIEGTDKTQYPELAHTFSLDNDHVVLGEVWKTSKGNLLTDLAAVDDFDYVPATYELTTTAEGKIRTTDEDLIWSLGKAAGSTAFAYFAGYVDFYFDENLDLTLAFGIEEEVGVYTVYDGFTVTNVGTTEYAPLKNFSVDVTNTLTDEMASTVLGEQTHLKSTISLVKNGVKSEPLYTTEFTAYGDLFDFNGDIFKHVGDNIVSLGINYDNTIAQESIGTWANAGWVGRDVNVNDFVKTSDTTYAYIGYQAKTIADNIINDYASEDDDHPIASIEFEVKDGKASAVTMRSQNYWSSLSETDDTAVITYYQVDVEVLEASAITEPTGFEESSDTAKIDALLGDFFAEGASYTLTIGNRANTAVLRTVYVTPEMILIKDQETKSGTVEYKWTGFYKTEEDKFIEFEANTTKATQIGEPLEITSIYEALGFKVDSKVLALDEDGNIVCRQGLANIGDGLGIFGYRWPSYAYPETFVMKVSNNKVSGWEYNYNGFDNTVDYGFVYSWGTTTLPTTGDAAAVVEAVKNIGKTVATTPTSWKEEFPAGYNLLVEKMGQARADLVPYLHDEATSGFFTTAEPTAKNGGWTIKLNNSKTCNSADQKAAWLAFANGLKENNPDVYGVNTTPSGAFLSIKVTFPTGGTCTVGLGSKYVTVIYTAPTEA